LLRDYNGPINGYFKFTTKFKAELMGGIT